MKKLLAMLLAAALCLGLLGTAAADDDKTVVLWTTEEEHVVDYYINALKAKFPEYNIQIENVSSGTAAAKVMEEGEHCSCDILWTQDYAYLEKCSDYLAELPDFDYSIFLEDTVPASHKYTPEERYAGGIILNMDMLEEWNLPEPTSYQDLLDPAYQGLISMPNPASSGTGYMFLRQLVNQWGEDEAFAYFEQLTPNILQYTSSGMGPVNALIQQEAAIGLGFISQAVQEINGGLNLKIVYFEEGVPFSIYGNALLKKSAEKTAAVEVFEYIATELVYDNNKLFYPEQIIKDFVPVVENYPTEIPYGDMTNNTLEEKERLLAKWTFS